MSKDSKIGFVEPNYHLAFFQNATSFAFDATSFAFDNASVVAGSNLSSEAALKTAREQWAWQKTNLSQGQKLSRGEGVVVAVLDSGVNYMHPDFNNKVLPGWSPYDGGDGQDVNGHGTFVAGIIHQVAPEATILPVRVLDRLGGGTLEQITEGAYWAADQGASVINFSLSAPRPSRTLRNLMFDLNNRNIVVVASAGNDNSMDDNFPAGIKSVVAVAATDRNDAKATFSNYGDYIDLSAPGVDIYSMYWKGGYGTANGTSFAAPIVTGMVALQRALHPNQVASSVTAKISDNVAVFPIDCKVPKGSCPNRLGKGRIDFSKLK